MDKFNINYKKINIVNKTISIKNFSIHIQQKILFENSHLTLAPSNIYGLLGINGTGKTTLLKTIADRIFPIDEKINILYVEQEIENTNNTPVEILLKTNKYLYNLKTQCNKLEQKIEQNNNDKNIYNKLKNIHNELKNLNFDKQESIIKKILFGLGFTQKMMNTTSNIFSGGWKMRISLAKALYIKPDILLLDEPTNHLDLESIIWLSEYLESELNNNIILIVSHNIGFLNQITTKILNIENHTIITYNGNYNNFKRNYISKIKKEEKEWNKLTKKIKKLKKKGKTKKELNLLIKKSGLKVPEKEYNVKIDFPEVGKFKSNIITVDNINFSYKNNIIFKNLSFGLDMNSRITLVGKNGSGKSTLLKLIMGLEKPSSGEIRYINQLRIGYYNQHFELSLPENKTPVEYLETIIPNKFIKGNKHHSIRSFLGKVKLSGNMHVIPIKQLSGGQKARVALVKLIFMQPHFILLDEPTNHLDIETVEALIEGLKNYNGGIMIITHESELITKLNSQLWILENNNITYYNNTYEEYCNIIIN